MANPIILAVDDEPDVLAAVRRDLQAHYASDYRVLGASSGEEAMNLLGEMALRDDEVALLLVDQRMPGVTGVDLLTRSDALFPAAKRALLTAYADTDAAIDAINEVHLDYYIMKPWDPPEERLYPILDDLLEEWWGQHRPQFSGVRVVGYQWSREKHELKNFLAANQLPYRNVDVESGDADALLKTAGASMSELPLVILTDGTTLRKPTVAELADRLGLHTEAEDVAYDLAIVGGGPAGLAGAVYGSSEGLRTLLIEEAAPGGQAAQSSRIENYLGFPRGLSGADLARRAVTQATRFGTEILVPAEVTEVVRNDPYRMIHLADGHEVTCKAMLITTGVSYRKLDRPGMERLSGVGVYYGTSQFEASNHAGESMFVIGGGNSAGQAAMFLSRFTDSVAIIIRRDDLSASMSQYLIDALDANPAVRIMPRTRLLEAIGKKRLESIRLEVDGNEETVPAGAVFVFIGQEPRTEWISNLVETDERGFILTGDDITSLKGWSVDRDPFPMETSVPGVFAAGDVRHGSTKRVATSTGEGAAAIRFIHQHLASL